MERIVLPPPEPGCVESELQAIFASLQLLLYLLARGDILDHGHGAQRPAGLVAHDIGRHPYPNRRSVFTDVALFHVEDGHLSSEQAPAQCAVAFALVRMRDVPYRRGEQLRLAIAHKLAHRSIGVEKTAGFRFN